MSAWGCRLGAWWVKGEGVHRLRGAWVDAAAREAAWHEQHRPSEHACYGGAEVEGLREQADALPRGRAHHHRVLLPTALVTLQPCGCLLAGLQCAASLATVAIVGLRCEGPQPAVRRWRWRRGGAAGLGGTRAAGVAARLKSK